MAEEERAGADIALELGGQKVNVRNVKSLNTILTLVAAGAACFGVYLMMEHQAEAKDAGKSFVGAIKEQTIAIQEQTKASREQTCILRFDQKDRQANAEFCKSISR